jgi:preprotein translocase subunit SecF
MKSTDARSRKSLMSFGVAALLAVGAATAQVATTGATGIDATGSYQSEVQACMSGATQQDRDTCMKEARNASAEKQRGRLETYGANDAHAMARCDVHQAGEDRAACQARVMGMGNADGSVAGGGVIREVETVVLPPGQNSVRIEPQTSNPVLLVPNR